MKNVNNGHAQLGRLQRRWFLKASSAALAFAYAGTARAGNSEDAMTKAFDLLRSGDEEGRVLALFGRKPDRSERTTTLGVQKAVLQFDDGPRQFELVFYSGHLWSKKISARKPGLLDGWGS